RCAHPQAVVRDQANGPGGVERPGDGAAIGPGQAAGPELLAAEVPNDDDAATVQPALEDHLQHGSACGAAWLAVVRETHLLAQFVRPAVVSGVRMVFPCPPELGGSLLD